MSGFIHWLILNLAFFDRLRLWRQLRENSRQSSSGSLFRWSFMLSPLRSFCAQRLHPSDSRAASSSWVRLRLEKSGSIASLLQGFPKRPVANLHPKRIHHLLDRRSSKACRYQACRVYTEPAPLLQLLHHFRGQPTEMAPSQSFACALPKHNIGIG
jgi:hypothetical protein